MLMILKATINLLIVVGLVGVQGSRLPGKSKLQISTSIIFSLNIIRVKILGQTSYNKSWVWGKNFRWLIIQQSIFIRHAYISSILRETPILSHSQLLGMEMLHMQL